MFTVSVVIFSLLINFCLFFFILRKSTQGTSLLRFDFKLAILKVNFFLFFYFFDLCDLIILTGCVYMLKLRKCKSCLYGNCINNYIIQNIRRVVIFFKKSERSYLFWEGLYCFSLNEINSLQILPLHRNHLNKIN